MTDPLAITAWSPLFSRLSSAVDLGGLARESQPLIRRRQIRTLEDLLRLALVYGSGLSLRATAAWAVQSGVADLSNVALLKRLRRAADWLLLVAGTLLSGTVPAANKQPLVCGRRLRVIDATCLSQPGSTGTDWRLHAVFDPAAQCFIALQLTDVHGGEGFHHFTPAAGELWLGDRGYISRNGLRHVLAHGADFLIRAGWNAFSWQTPQGQCFDLFSALRRCGDHGQWPVRLAGPGAPIAARLIARRKPPQATVQEQARLRKEAKRRGKTLDPRSLEAAGWLLLVTSLAPEALPMTEALALYRVRWQIELSFKRLKSLGSLDQLPANDPQLARAWIAAKLIIALLTDQVTQGVLDSPPCAHPSRQPTSLDLALA